MLRRNIVTFIRYCNELTEYRYQLLTQKVTKCVTRYYDSRETRYSSLKVRRYFLVSLNVSFLITTIMKQWPLLILVIINNSSFFNAFIQAELRFYTDMLCARLLIAFLAFSRKNYEHEQGSHTYHLRSNWIVLLVNSSKSKRTPLLVHFLQKYLDRYFVSAKNNNYKCYSSRVTYKFGLKQVT